MISKLFVLIRILSLHIVAGALVGALVISKVVDNAPSLSTYILLGLTVWIIYTFDHLLDAARLNGITGTRRHEFHKQNFKTLSVLLGLGILIVFGLLFNQPRYVIINGSILAIFVGLYFVMINLMPGFSGFVKEITAALIYSVGLLIPGVDLTSASREVYFIFSIYLIFAWLNLLIISVFEKNVDIIHNYPSLIRKLGNRKIFILIHILFAMGFLIIFGVGNFLIETEFRAIPLLFAIMLITLLVIFKFQAHFKRYGRYRIWSDMIFIFPVIFI